MKMIFYLCTALGLWLQYTVGQNLKLELFFNGVPNKL